MKAGYLSQYFSGVAIKRLTSVEANPYSSNQHEFNGVSDLKKIFGKANGKIRFDTKFLYLNDYDDEPVAADGYLTWYDAREKNPYCPKYRQLTEDQINEIRLSPLKRKDLAEKFGVSEHVIKRARRSNRKSI